MARSKKSTRRTGSQNNHVNRSQATKLQDARVPVKLQDPESVAINWLFFDKSRPPAPLVLEIPHILFNRPSQYCRELFVEELRGEHDFEAHIKSVKFWKPKQQIHANAFRENKWPETFRNVESIAKMIQRIQKFSNVFKEEFNDEHVHLIVTAEGADGAPDESLNQITDLPEIIHFRNNIRYTPVSPSEAAKSLTYVKIQGKIDGAIYDGRHPYLGELSTTATPINIFHPVFEAFIRRLQRPTQEPTCRYLRLVGELMDILSQIRRPEWRRAQDFRERLKEVLGYVMILEGNDDDTCPDGAIGFEIEGIRIRLCLAEIKVEMGEGGCDPSTQASMSARSFWLTKKNFFPVRDKTCCPTILLAGGGAWLTVLGAVFTDRPIVQRLTETLWMANSTTHRDNRVVHISHVFLALRGSIQDLAEYYTTVTTDQGLKPFNVDSNDPHPRFFPYVTAVKTDSGLIRFKYLRRLEDDATCVTFLALAQLEDGSEKEVVVKFVTKYNEKVHNFLHANGYAPKLYYHGAIPTAGTILNTIPLLDDKDSLLRRPLPSMNMVIMEYIEPGSWPGTRDIAGKQLKAVLELLHINGYVFGDLRKPNVLFTQVEAKLKLIDFDWAGVYKRNDNGEVVPPTDEDHHVDWEHAYYPSGLSGNIKWPNGVYDFAAIIPEHDDEMMVKLLNETYT